MGTGNSDIITGTQFGEILYGYSDSDQLAGKNGDDTLIGGSGGDTYSIGVGEGNDIIDDQGGDNGIDTLNLYVGDLASAFDFNWFKLAPNGSDLLVQMPDGHGGLAINVRIENMGTDAGRIEDVALYLGDNTAPSNTWDLANVWAQLTETSAPSTPRPAPPPSSNAPGSVPPSPSDSHVFTYIGTSGDNLPTFGPGNDVAAGLGGVDGLGGGGGDDTLLGNSGSDVLTGGDGNDLLVDDRVESDVSLGGDYLDGGNGDDTLVIYGAPSPLQDTGIGGPGDDFALVDLSDRSADWHLLKSGSDILVRPENTSLEGTVDLHSDIETIAVLFGSGDDFAHGGNEVDYFDGGDGNDNLVGTGGDSLIGGAGDDELNGQAGDWLDGGSGHDVVHLALDGVSENLTFMEDEAESSNGFTFADGTHVQNVEEFDELLTGGGNDQFWFGDGYIRIESNGGNDIFHTTGHGDETIDGGSGQDDLVIDYSWATDHVRTQANDNGSFWTFVGQSEAQNSAQVVASNVENMEIRGGSDDDYLTTGNGDDTLIGNNGGDALDGKQGNNSLFGGDGNDILLIDGGTNWIDGGEGTDLVEVTRVADQHFTFDGAQAASSTGYTLSDGSFVRNVEALNLGSGNGGMDVSLSGHGHNYITLGGGDNTIAVDFSWSSAPIVTSYANYQWETYLSSDINAADVTIWPAGLSAYSLHLTLTGGTDADRLGGTSLDDIIRGGAGNDVLSGNGGADVFVFGTGDGQDTISDFSADDIIDVSGLSGFGSYVQLKQVGGDTLVVFSADDTLLLQNVVATSLTDANFHFNVAPPIEGNDNPNLLNGTSGPDVIDGLGGNDTLNGLAGNDRLDGGLGADTMAGGTGDDTYVVGNSFDKVGERLNEGTDTVLSSITYTLSPNVENLTLTGTANINATGNSVNNIIHGNTGNNLLDGGAGADKMYGGVGDDIYVVGNAFDAAVENAGEGTDTVRSSVTYTIGANIENLTLTGTAAIDGTGNALNNIIYGNGGDNKIDGAAGADTMYGGTGNDTYVVGDSLDQAIESANSGTDTVLASASYTLGANIENLTLTGTANITAIGNSVNNIIYGNAGNNLIDGGGGADTMYGGAGDDTYVVGNSFDKAMENGGQGTDVVQSSVTYALGDNVEILILTGTVNINATGNSLDNILVGNSGNNSLFGGAGSDTFVFSANSGADIIKDFSVSDNDRIDVSAWTHGTADLTLIHTVGGNTVIDFGSGNTVTIAATAQADVISHIVW